MTVMFSSHSIDSIKQSLDADLDNASKRLAKNKLHLKVNKTKIMQPIKSLCS